MIDNRISTEKLGKSMAEFMKHVPPVSEQDIDLVKMNPNLSFIQRLIITRKMKRIMRKKGIRSIDCKVQRYLKIPKKQKGSSQEGSQ